MKDQGSIDSWSIESKYCKECGEWLFYDWKYCPMCAAPALAYRQNPPREDPYDSDHNAI